MNCGFCYQIEQGKNGEVIREWSFEWRMFIPVCRKHKLMEYEEWLEMKKQEEKEYQENY